MAKPPLLALRDATVRFDGRPTFSGVSVALSTGDRVCLVGRNGGGKSTLLKALAGVLEVDAGSVFRQPGARIAYVPQQPVFDPTLTASAFVGQNAEAAHVAEAVLEEVGVPADRLLANLSGGESRRVSLAHALAGNPDILLLDEPTNHLDIAAVEWLEERLAAHRAGLLLISHDRAFLTRLSNRTLWLDRGTLREHDKGYADFEAWSEGILTAEAATEQKLDRLIARETVWSREGISARRKRNQGRLHRLYSLRSQKAQRISLGSAKMESVSAQDGGRLVIEAEGISKSFGGTVILRNFSTRIMRGDRVGIIGRNGAGKSTLINILAGTMAPDSGTVRLGTNLQAATVDQFRAALDPEQTLWETLTEGGNDTVFVQGKPQHVTSYLKEFLFEDRQFRAKVSTLSGGERNRLLLARILAQPSNLLILDEPTNDLDMETLDLLQEVLSDYDGTLLLVTHDRDFLDRLVTSTIAVEGDGVVHEYVGGYADYLRQRRAPVAPKPGPKSAAPVATAERPRAVTKLSYKEQRDLQLLPGQIAKLEEEKATLETALAAPETFKDRAAFDASLKRHHQIVTDLAAAEERWLALAAREEELAQGKSG
jgi:ATP-binding cassette subfamily F protein uup